MRLPPLDLPAIEWGAALVERWTVLVSKANQMEANTGNNDAFERMVAIQKLKLFRNGNDTSRAPICSGTR